LIDGKMKKTEKPAIEEDDNGTCRFYGYCVEEKRVWDLEGQSCAPEYNTCVSYQDRSGQVNSYLANTLEYNGCAADNVGCQWYCTQYNAISNEWICDVDKENVLSVCTTPGGCEEEVACRTGAIDTSIPAGEDTCSDADTILTLTEACSEGSQFWDPNALAGAGGCSLPADESKCTIPEGGVACENTGCELLPDLLQNGDFEIVDGPFAANWSVRSGDLTYFERVSGAIEKIHSGSNSLRFFKIGGSVSATPPPLNSNIVDSTFFQIWPEGCGE